MLNIVKEIECLGLDVVVAKYSLVCKDAGHKILLKYHQIVFAASGFFYRHAANILRGEVSETLNARYIVITVGADKLEKIFS